MGGPNNAIYCGDCNEVLQQYIPNDSVDLIYADPPFFSNRQHEILWGDGYELRAYADRWKNGIETYIDWMVGKLRECHRVLKPTGSMYLHCDWHASHYLKVEMDRIFGDRLVNHIVWKRTPARTGGDRIRSYGAVHDDILFYSKTDNYVFNPQYLPLDKENLDRLYTKDKDGRRYLLAALTGLGFRKNKLGNPWKGFEPNKSGRHWIFSISQLEAWDREGRIYFPKKEGSFPSYKRYLDEAEGQLVQDVWEDIKPVHLKAKESFGYPSQKPQALLERVVLASSNPGSLVLDPFCGSGTSIVVAHRLHRKWIGIDVSPTACNIMAARLRKLRPLALDTKIIGLPRNFDKPSDRK